MQALGGAAVGLVVDPLPALVHDHVALGVEVLLGEGGQEEAHAVRFEPEAEVEVMGRQGLVVVGAVVPGGAVGHAAHLLEVAEVLVGGDVLAALEEHVLEQVGEAGAAGPLVLGAHVVPEVDGDQRQAAVRMEHHPQAVGEGGPLERELRGPGGEIGSEVVRVIGRETAGSGSGPPQGLAEQ